MIKHAEYSLVKKMFSRINQISSNKLRYYNFMQIAYCRLSKILVAENFKILNRYLDIPA